MYVCREFYNIRLLLKKTIKLCAAMSLKLDFMLFSVIVAVGIFENSCYFRRWNSKNERIMVGLIESMSVTSYLVGIKL